MITFVQELERRMLDQLEEVARHAETDLQQAERSYLMVGKYLKELHAFCQDHTFESRQEEITYFKEIKPRFMREWIFYLQLFHLESRMPVGGTEALAVFLKQHLDGVHQYLTSNQFLYVYHRSGQTNMDEQFFVAEPDDSLQLIYTQDGDPDIGNKFSYVLAKIQAYEDLAAYLLRRMDAAAQGITAIERDKKEVKWEGNLAQLYEVGYAFVTSGLVSGTVKGVIERLGHTFSVKPGNYYRYMLNMRIRKKSPTPCLDLMAHSLVEYMSQADLDPKYR